MKTVHLGTKAVTGPLGFILGVTLSTILGGVFASLGAAIGGGLLKLFSLFRNFGHVRGGEKPADGGDSATADKLPD